MADVITTLIQLYKNCAIDQLSMLKLHYVPIAQCNVGWSAGVQMSYILPPYLSKTNTFCMTFCGWPAKNNKAVDKWSKVICLLKIMWRFILSFLVLYIYIYIYIYNIIIYIILLL